MTTAGTAFCNKDFPRGGNTNAGREMNEVRPIDSPPEAGGTDRAASFRQHLTRRWAPTAEPILIVGDAMLDVNVFGTVEGISP